MAPRLADTESHGFLSPSIVLEWGGLQGLVARREESQVGPARLREGSRAAVRGLKRPVPDDTSVERLRLCEVHLARFKLIGVIEYDL